MALCAGQSFADTAFVANKNLAAGFSDGTHFHYFVFFAVSASRKPEERKMSDV
jgi:hypothetical protein